MAAPNKGQFAVVDINGDKGSSNFHVIDSTVTIASLNALATAYSAASNCKIIQVSLTLKEAQTGTATDAIYENTTDKAILEFKSSDTGQTTRFSVAGPKKAMFMANQKDIDPSAPLAAALISAIQSTCATTGNAQGLEFVRGWRDKT